MIPLASSWRRRLQCVVWVAFIYPGSSPGSAAEIEFQRDIRPILSDACFHCHGPDQETREADLRLDTHQGVLAERNGHAAVVAGDASQSHLYLRITHADRDERMPPADATRQLTQDEIERVRQWINAGADWNQLWSLVEPQRPPFPSVSNPARLRGGIDAFVGGRLDNQGLEMSAEATRETFIRRVTLDLTGLPPTLGRVDAFLIDRSPAASERVVDRLLASPRYGERMALAWLDAARYADTSGYQTDGPRQMWRWRNWLIDALNAGMPYDQFTIEQLAGDLLPETTLEQTIATGFNRNHRGNAEGGIIAEEYRVEYVVDRVDTTATVWLGLTIGCARCHDHKYDSLSQREFYQLFAFFNNVPERGKARKWGNAKPRIKAPTQLESRSLSNLDRQIEAAHRRIVELEPQFRAAQKQWESELASEALVDQPILGNPLVHVTLDGTDGAAPPESGTSLRWENQPSWSPGRIGQAGDFDGQQFLEVGDVAKFDFTDAFSIGVWVLPRSKAPGAIVSRMQSDTLERRGYSVEMADGHIHVNLVHRWLDDCIRVRSVRQLSPDSWNHILVTYDGSRFLQGIGMFVNGQREPLEILVDDMQQSFQVDEPLRIGARGTHVRFQGLIDDVQIFDRRVSEQEARVLAVPDNVQTIANIPPDQRRDNQTEKIRAFFTRYAAPDVIRHAYQQLASLQDERHLFMDQVSTVMVMQEMETPRQTHILERGRYDQPGQHVEPDVPAIFPSLPADGPRNRLQLARWLFDPSHPLTARVATNRIWQHFFGQGLVRTAEDFGSQGEKPSHPLLLDWLATEFIRIGWDTKRLQKQIVTSATYRQSSQVTPELLTADPENRLLGRGPRNRLPAHLIRDAALASSGLLVERLGGPSVKPYQPEGLWVEMTSKATPYVRDTGQDLYRRSLYTYWKRTIAPPEMMVLDAAQREMCRVRTAQTNTPLQALTLMNDITFVEAARVLAERTLREGGSNDASRIEYAHRLVTARRPHQAEMAILRQALELHRQHFHGQPEKADQLVSFGDARAESSLATSELAAYTALMNVLLNLDETVTKE